MNPAERPSALDVFRRALDLDDPDARARFVTEQCDGDAELLREVEELLSAESEPGVLDRPPSRWREDTSDLVGTRIGPYHLLELLGRGGMGEVYLAQQREPIERRVAVKVVGRDIASEEILARFESERRALALMNHPNIAQVHDAGHAEDGRPYFVMEHVPGTSITRFADEARLDFRERLALFGQVLEAIQHAHQKGVIHRDIKPANVLVDASAQPPQVKVIDFGVAKAIDRRLTPETLHTLSGRLVGTLEYMSPEQATGERVEDDTRSDLYSAAMLLYELLAGALPFDGERFQSSSLAEIHHLITEADPPLPSRRARELTSADPGVARSRGLDPSQMPRTLEGELDSIILKGLEKSLTRRYQSASAFREDIEAYLDDRPITATPPSRAYRTRKFVRRHRIAVAASTSVVLALVVGLVVATLGLREAAEGKRTAEDALVRVESEARKAAAMFGFLEDMLLSASPDTTQGRDDRVLREVLDRAAERATTDLADHPEGEVAIRTTIAHTYLSLGRFEEAGRELDRAEARLERTETPSTRIRLDLAHVRGRVFTQLGAYDRAEAMLQEALSLVASLPAEDPEAATLKARIRRDLGWLLLQREDLDGAVAEARAALEVFEADDDERESAIEARNLIALVLKYQENYEEAEALYRRSIEEARGLGENHPFLSQLESNLGMLCLYTERAEEGETLLEQSLARREKIFDPDHTVLAEGCNNLAIAKQLLGKRDDAVPLFERARSILEQNVDSMHPHLASLSYNIAELHEENENFEDAVREYRRATSIDEAQYGETHSYVARDRFQLARALYKGERYEEAERAAIRAVTSYEGAEQPVVWQLSRAISLRGSCRAKLDRREDAEKDLLEAYRMMSEDLGGGQGRTLEVRRLLHDFYIEGGQPEKAESWQ